MRNLITAQRLILQADSDAALEDAAVLIEDGHIAAIGARGSLDSLAYDGHDDYPDGTICPAFLDIHIHGGLGHDVMEASPAFLQTIGIFLATHGVGAYYPTTVTAPIDDTLRALAGLAKIIHQPAGDGATPLGVHLEGPFISHEKRGVHPPESIQKPTLALFDRFWEASEGTIRLMTIAPEVEGAIEVIDRATRLGVRVSLGHSNADTAAAKRGIAAGAQSATHTFNAMRPLDHRDPGILGTVLDTEKLYAELICDGIHVDPMVVRLFWKAVGRDRGILITDGISATGMPDGEYMLGGFRVQVKDGRCLHDGHLAGSVLTLDRAVRNFFDYTAAALQDVLGLVTKNPATLTGVAGDHGHLAVGRAADLNVVTSAGELCATYLRGRRVE
jgi:N-acetylglucosamine-6-phosphate deacetylase